MSETRYHTNFFIEAISLKRIVLLPGETDGVMWAGYGKIHWMIRTKKICRVIASQYLRQESELKKRNVTKLHC